MLNYNHLYYFYMAAKSGGITAAAKILKVSQPSLSSQLKVLEDTLDLSLFRKVGRNNELTDAGLVVYGFCRRMFEVSEELTELVMERLPSVSRRLTLGVSDEIETTFVVEVVSHFLKKHTPETRPRVSMISASHEQLSERLRFRELDAIISQRPMVDPDLSSLEHIESPVGLFSSKTSRFGKTTPSNANPLTIQKLVGGPDAQWIKPTLKTKLRAESDLFFEQHEIKGRVVFESDVVASLTRSVVDDIGFCFLPLLYVYDEVRDRKIMQIGSKKGYWKYRVWLGCHVQNREDPLVLSFSRSFTDVSKNLL